MKYIIYDDGMNDVPVLFPSYINHKDMAIKLEVLDKIISAGFVRFEPYISDELKIFCYGESQSLGVDSRGSMDTILVKVCFKS